jgi:catechol 2,3-dioxygenase-like lactoylglutathione lyase family enzyme
VITGIHAIMFSPQAEKVRAFLADVLGMPSVDAGGGWLIFALPPAELAVHPADGAGHHELYLMCDDIQATLAELKGRGAEVARDVSDQGWGLLAAIRLPDGSEFPVYEPRHPSPRLSWPAGPRGMKRRAFAVRGSRSAGRGDETGDPAR